MLIISKCPFSRPMIDKDHSDKKEQQSLFVYTDSMFASCTRFPLGANRKPSLQQSCVQRRLTLFLVVSDRIYRLSWHQDLHCQNLYQNIYCLFATYSLQRDQTTRKSNFKSKLENPTWNLARKSNLRIQLENPTRNLNSKVYSLSLSYFVVCSFALR